jgi:hypothetical protein
MLHPYEVKGEHAINFNGSRITLSALEHILRMIQKHGEVYAFNLSTEPPQTLVELWAELNVQAEQREIKDYVKKLDFKDGDVLFVDSDVVEFNTLIRGFPIHKGRVSLVPVSVPYGKTLDQCIEKKGQE